MSSAFTEAPTIVFTGSLINSIPAGDLRLSSVSQSMGSSPGVAVISVPGYRPHQVPDTAGDDVYINMDGYLIFHGWVMEVHYGEDPNNTEVDLYCYDARAYLENISMGDPRHPDFDVVGTDLTFNKQGRPDKDPNALAWARSSKAAVFWSITDIIDYLATWTELGGVDLDLETFKDATGATDYPGEVALGFQPVGSALDSVISMLGGDSWALDYLDDKVYRISLDDLITTRTLYYYTTAGTATEWTANSWNTTFTSRRSRNKVFAISGPRLTESTWDLSNLDKDEAYKSPIFKLRFTPKVDAYLDDLGPGLATDGQGKDWASNLITRKTLAGEAYRTDEEFREHPNEGVALNDRDCIWVQKKVEDNQETQPWWRVTGGWEVEQWPPAILLEKTITAHDGTGTEETPGAQELQVPADIHDIRMTIVTETGYQTWAPAVQSTPYPYDSVLLLDNQDLQILARDQAYAPDLEDGKTAIDTVIHDEDYWSEVDIEEKLSPKATKALRAGKRVYREVTANLEVPQVLALGWGMEWLPTGPEAPMINPATDPLIIVGVDIYFEDQQKTVVRAVNQLGGDYAKQRPAAESVLTAWRYQKQAQNSALAFLARSQARKEAQQAQEGASEAPGGTLEE